MALEYLLEYDNLVLDYSVIREFGGTSLFFEFMDVIAVKAPDVYVSSSFKLLHYCLVHQGDAKDDAAAAAMKELCSMLLPMRKLHSVQTSGLNGIAVYCLLQTILSVMGPVKSLRLCQGLMSVL